MLVVSVARCTDLIEPEQERGCEFADHHANGYAAICAGGALLEVTAASAHSGPPAAADRSLFPPEQLGSFDDGTLVWQRYWEVAALFARAAVLLAGEALLARAPIRL